jgi:tRNA 2-thiouridine synthesizing protein A
MTDHTLDARGLKCPMPILRTRKALKDVPIGEVLAVLATDPGAVKDFEAFCRTTGNELVESVAEAGVLRFRIRHLG